MNDRQPVGQFQLSRLSMSWHTLALRNFFVWGRGVGLSAVLLARAVVHVGPHPGRA